MELPPPPNGHSRKTNWLAWRAHVLFWTGMVVLGIGVHARDPAVMTIGAGLAGFVPVAKAVNGHG